jgi:hypothetical protein
VKVSRKQQLLDATQWHLGQKHKYVMLLPNGQDYAVTVNTGAPRVMVRDGDWIVVAPDGTISIISDADFHAQYEVL